MKFFHSPTATFQVEISDYLKQALLQHGIYDSKVHPTNLKAYIRSIDCKNHILPEVEIEFQITNPKGEVLLTIARAELRKGDTLTLTEIDKVFEINLA